METNYKVYVHISPNGKRYYGITKQEVNRRWRNGYSYKFWIDKKGKKHGNEHFWNSICKYGWNEGFEHIVIARGLTEEEAKWLEIELIREHDTTNPKYGYNQSLGGEGGNGHVVTEETRKKIGKANKGKKMSEEARKKMSEKAKGRKMSEEARKKMSESRKGHETTEETIKKISETKKGHKHSEETRKKMSESHKGKTHSEETRKKLSESHKRHETTEETIKKISETKKGRNGTKVYCVELDMYFNSIKEASEYIGSSNISKVLRGKNKTAKGYHWIYAEDVEIENSKVS